MMALEGIRVIDWTIFQQGPMSTTLLADLGAEVIKVEDPVLGDPARGVRRSFGVPTELPGGRSILFEHHNRNKKGIAVDLKKEKGREVIYRLVSESDVFVQNWRAGVAERLGMGYETLKRLNPRLIYANGSGFGPKGPERASPSLDAVGMARSGIMWNVGEPGPMPHVLTPSITDQMAAMMLSYGILAALLARERLGIGQQIHSSHLGSMMALQTYSITQHLVTGMEYGRHDRDRAPNPLYNYYRCKDGTWVFLALLQSQRHWPSFCRALEVTSIEQDPRFCDAESREHNAEELVRLLDKVFATKSYEEWNRQLRLVSDDFIYSQVQNYGDLSVDPQVLANEYITEFDHPALGRIKMTGFPVTYEETPGTLRMPAPEHGEHTEQVLMDICGYSWDDVLLLKEDGVIP